MTRSEGKRRLNVELPDDVATTVDELSSAEGATKTDLVRRAVTLYALAVETDRKGGKIMLVDADGTEVRLMFLIPRRRRGRRRS